MPHRSGSTGATRLLVIADPRYCPETCDRVRKVYPGAQVDCIDLDEAQRDMGPLSGRCENLTSVYATVILAIPGLDSMWRDVLRTIRAKFSYRVLPIVVIGPEKWEHEAMMQEDANGYVPSDSDPSQGRYFHNLLSALAPHSGSHHAS